MMDRDPRLTVILDANILISWAIASPDSRSWPRLVTDWILSGNATLIVPNLLLDEVQAVARRPKLRERSSPDRWDWLIAFLESLATGQSRLQAQQQQMVLDVNDQYLLDAASSHRVDALITGDKDLLSLATNADLKWIVTAAEFAARYLDEPDQH